MFPTQTFHILVENPGSKSGRLTQGNNYCQLDSSKARYFFKKYIGTPLDLGSRIPDAYLGANIA